MTAIERLHTQSPEAFLRELRRSHPQWLDDKHGPECGWIFRGQPDASQLLIPSAFRADPNQLLGPLRRDIREKHGHLDFRLLLRDRAAEISCDNDQLAEVAIDALTHAGAARLFMTIAHEVRRQVPFSDLLHHVFNPDRDEFCRYFTGDLGPRPDDVFAIAQHHRIPTQFLDWTLDPLIAAYFAASRATPSSCSSARLAVWALRRDLFDCDWRLCRYSVEPGLTPFLDAQAGLFTWSRRAYIDRANRGFYVPFDQLVEEEAANAPLCSLPPPPFLKQVTLPAEFAEGLLKLLWTERVTPAHLMPTFDHVAEAVCQKVKWL